MDEQPKSLNLLSLDAGGPKALSQLHILDAIMDQLSRDEDGSLISGIEKRPCEVFDMIGGVDTGGFIAILLAVLQLTAKEAMEEFIAFTSKVYANIDKNPKRQTEKLKRAVMELLQCHGIDPNAKMIPTQGQTPACKLTVFIMYKKPVGSTCVLRNYASREMTTNLTIAEAMVATCAFPPLFDPVSVIMDFSTREFVGGGPSFSNPVRELLNEAQKSYGSERTVCSLLSLGSGLRGGDSLPDDPRIPPLSKILDDMAVDSEWTAGEMRKQMPEHTLYHRLSVSHGLQTSHSQSWTDPRWISAQSITYLDDIETEEPLGLYVDTVRLEQGYATLEQLTRSGGAVISALSLPPPAANYVSREAPMHSITRFLIEADGSLKPGAKMVVVTGLGGCGKTQLVRRFVEEFGNRFTSAFFVDGTSKDTIRNGITRYVRSLGSAHSQKSFNESMKFLSEDATCQQLMVIDNLDDDSIELASFLPRWTDGVVMITSRSASRGQLSPSTHLKLDVMSLEEAVEMLARGMNAWPLEEARKPAFKRLATDLTRHPIAIVQAISYMWNAEMTVETYTARLNTYRTKLTRDYTARNQTDRMKYVTAYAAFSASYDVMPRTVQMFCHILSFLHRQKFPLRLIMLAVRSNFSTVEHEYIKDEGDAFKRGRECLVNTFCPSGPLDDVGLDDMVTQLKRHSLVTIIENGNEQILEMHQLVHDWGRLHIPGDEDRYRDAAVRLLCCGAIKNNQLMSQYLFNHVQQLKDTWKSLHANDAASFSFILDQSGMHKEAAELMEMVNETLETQLGRGHVSTIKSSLLLANHYDRMGRTTEARMRRQQEEVRRNTEMFGKDDPITIEASAALAITISKFQRESSRMMEWEPRRPRQQILGSTTHESPRSTLLSIDNFGENAIMSLPNGATRTNRMVMSPESTMDDIHMADDEIMHELEVLRQTEEAHGPRDPETISARERLARRYSTLGRYSEAEQTMRNVQIQRKTTLGEDHPQTINAALQLAAIYDKMGSHAEAADLVYGVLMQRTQNLGEAHHETFSARFYYATILCKIQRHAEAEEIVQRALEICQEQFMGTTNEIYTFGSGLLARIRQQPRLTSMAC